MSIKIETSYDISDFPQFDAAVVSAAGRHSSYSGAGMGRRDHGWVCESEIEAHRIKRGLEKIGLTAVMKP